MAKKLTKKEIAFKKEKMNCVREYIRVIRELDRLQVSASNCISRKDNNEVFEIRCKLKEIVRRMLKEYNLPLDDPYFH